MKITKHFAIPFLALGLIGCQSPGSVTDTNAEHSQGVTNSINELSEQIKSLQGEVSLLREELVAQSGLHRLEGEDSALQRRKRLEDRLAFFEQEEIEGDKRVEALRNELASIAAE